MPGKSRRRKMSKRYLRGNVEEELALAALPAGDVTSAPFDHAVVEQAFISSVVASWSMTSLTIGADIGPFTVGLAHSDYTPAEIEEFLENSGAWDLSDKIAQEKAKRLIRIVGTFPGPPGGGLGTAVLNDGKPIKTKLNWRLITGKTLQVWVRNGGSQPVATTVPDIKVDGHANIWL